LVADGIERIVSNYKENAQFREFCDSFFDPTAIARRFDLADEYDFTNINSLNAKNFLEALDNKVIEEIYENYSTREKFNKHTKHEKDMSYHMHEVCHVFETVTDFGVPGGKTLHLIFAIKQRNKRKLNSHLWFFGGFCYLLDPKFI
jgi:hypothetical protein